MQAVAKPKRTPQDWLVILGVVSFGDSNRPAVLQSIESVQKGVIWRCFGQNEIILFAFHPHSRPSVSEQLLFVGDDVIGLD